jgi:putative ABC transport system substrate-binding protein
MSSRRQFISLLGGAAVWSSVAGAQTARKRPVIGTFMQGTSTQNKGLRFRQSFLDGLRELGDIEGRDFDVIIQPARFTSELPKAAEQLVQFNPDVILAAARPILYFGSDTDRHCCSGNSAPDRFWISRTRGNRRAY